MMKYYCKRYLKLLKKILLECFALIGGFYTTFEVLILLFPNQTTIFETIFKISMIFSAIFALFHNHPKRKFIYQIRNNDIKITIVIGNLFKQKGAKIIPTNTTFDTKMEAEFISSKSVQGQFQKIYYSNNITTLDKLMDKELENNNYILLDRNESKRKQYQIGTVMKLNMSTERFYFLATADVNINGKPNSNFENIQISLEALWNYILEKGHMEPIVIPVIGTGKTGINVTRQKIIKEIIFSFMVHTNEKKISDELVICIHPNDIENIDIDELDEYLNYMCKYHYENNKGKANGIPVEEKIKI